MNRTAESGGAIVAALLVVALAASAASGVLVTQSIWLAELEASRDASQCRAALRAGFAWAAAVLRQDARISTVDHLHEAWTTPLPRTSIEGAEVSGAISDLQGRYNLNNLVRDGVAVPHEVVRYRRLLSLLGLSSALADSLVDWIDADDQPTGPDGAENSYYASLPVPYRTAGRPLIGIGELARVKGYDASALAVLMPLVTVLPDHSAINVNTAPAAVLTLAAGDLSLTDAQLLLVSRDRSYFRDVDDFRSRLPATAGRFDPGFVRVNSEYFSVSARAARGRGQASATAKIRRRFDSWPEIIEQRDD